MKKTILLMGLISLFGCKRIENKNQKVIEIIADEDLLNKKYAPVKELADKIYYPNDLIEIFIEFNSLTPNTSEWNIKSLKSNPPRLYRLKQLKALNQAYFKNQESDFLKSFVNGDFIDNYPINQYDRLLDTIINKYKDNKFYESSISFTKESWSHNEVKRVFKNLIDFRIKTYSYTNYNSGYLEVSSISSRFMIDLTKNVINDLDINKVKDIDKILSLIINPNGLSFCRRDLVEKFGFPDVDIDEIDSDWY